MEPKSYTLADLANFIRRVFALNLPEAVWVTAELAQVSHSRGHRWLTLVEKDPEGTEVIAQLEGVVWANQLGTLQRSYGLKLIRDLFQDGMSVRLKVSTAFHPRYGLRLVVEDLDPAHTIGALEQRRRETLEELARADLLHRNANVPLPLVPQRLAVISSDTAAGLADFERQLLANPYDFAFKLTRFPAAMQGTQTGPEITTRLRQIARSVADFDAVVIVRGGGSRMDLAAFDGKELAVAVAEFPLPVLVGIGHETDASVLDQVAHRSLKTPTAVAVFLLDRLLQVESRIMQLGQDVRQTAQRTLDQEQLRLQRYADQAHWQAASVIREENLRLNGLERLLQALRPETTLARGYALVSQHGQLIVDPAELQPGTVEVKLQKGRTQLQKSP
ncbi:MAG: exodeoxyribonuclease VII large subunit [Bacteroidota bacterium]